MQRVPGRIWPFWKSTRDMGDSEGPSGETKIDHPGIFPGGHGTIAPTRRGFWGFTASFWKRLRTLGILFEPHSFLCGIVPILPP